MTEKNRFVNISIPRKESNQQTHKIIVFHSPQTLPINHTLRNELPESGHFQKEDFVSEDVQLFTENDKRQINSKAFLNILFIM